MILAKNHHYFSLKLHSVNLDLSDTKGGGDMCSYFVEKNLVYG